MTEYAKDCWNEYLIHRSESRLVKCVYGKALKNSRGKNWVRQGTEALVKISRERGPDEFIPLQSIRERSGNDSSGTGGLWLWLKEKNGADVLEKRLGPESYRIWKQFFSSMLELFPTNVGPSETHRIMELAGLGKEIWKGVDPDRYVREERSSWGG